MRWRRVLRSAFLALWAVPVAAPVLAQTVDPPFEVHQGQARSSFVISNGSLFPLTFVVEARSFDIASCGDLSFQPLDSARVQVRVSTMSGRLPARQQRRVQYDVSADSLPAWVAFVVTFGTAGRDPGLGTRMQLVHFAYLNQRTPVFQDEVVVREAVYDSRRGRVSVTIENRSDKLTRVLLMSLVDRRGEEHPIEACPFLPHRTRSVDAPWRLPDPPVRVLLRFPGFSLEAPVVTHTPADSVAPARP
jgi:hypothetical protein